MADKNIIINLIYFRLLSEADRASQEAVAKWTEDFIKTLPSNASEGVFFRSEVQYDNVTNKYYPVIIQHIHGIDYRYALDENFYESLDYSMLRSMNERVADLIEEGGFVLSGSKKIEVKNFHEAYETLMKEGFSGVKIQRYKGLGEMSPEQLSETTMNPASRSLLKVNITDAMEADRLFNELMGEDVENRKTFISENASRATIDI